MATEALVKRVKELLALAKGGNVDDALAGYAALFSSSEFMAYPTDERRHAIKLVVNARVPPSRPSKSVVLAHQAAKKVLEVAIKDVNEPADYELLGICLVVEGDEKRAADVFRQGLTLERSRNPQSDLCGSLMKWVAAV